MSLSNITPEDLLTKTHKISNRRAEKLASFDLVKWPIKDVDTILKQVHMVSKAEENPNPCGPEFNTLGWPWLTRLQQTLVILMVVGATGLLLPLQVAGLVSLVLRRRFRMIWQELPIPTFIIWQWGRDIFRFLKTPIETVRESIHQRAALCVNACGSFKVMTSGYTIMSHVWAETMGWNAPDGFGPVELSVRKKGISFGHFEKFFQRCGAEWLWVDVLAMPEILEDMNSAEKVETEKMRIDIINCLRDIYTRADKVVILDSMTLQLRTGSVIDVALTLVCGYWITRMWTYSEARLAKKAFIRTRNRLINLDEVINYLRENCTNSEHRYYGLMMRMECLRPRRGAGKITLDDVYKCCLDRYSEAEVDQARALYPLLGLIWKNGWTLQNGLLNIKIKFPEQRAAFENYCNYRNLTTSWETSTERDLAWSAYCRRTLG